VLAADLATSAIVHPIYVASGLAWESGERQVLEDALAGLPEGLRMRPLVTLDVPMTDVYPPTHWAITGAAPGYDTPDEDVYLVGRNVALIGKSAVYCALHRIPRLCLAPLGGNPFPDATPEFFATMGLALSMGLSFPLAIEAPYRTWSKADVITRGHALGVPLELTVSCMNPDGVRHCGDCSKCRERHHAFIEALGCDPTAYLTPRMPGRRQ
jgi:7-cyano-7-deazaguanine synthase